MNRVNREEIRDADGRLMEPNNFYRLLEERPMIEKDMVLYYVIDSRDGHGVLIYPEDHFDARPDFTRRIIKLSRCQVERHIATIVKRAGWYQEKLDDSRPLHL